MWWAALLAYRKVPNKKPAWSCSERVFSFYRADFSLGNPAGVQTLAALNLLARLYSISEERLKPERQPT